MTMNYVGLRRITTDYGRWRYHYGYKGSVLYIGVHWTWNYYPATPFILLQDEVCREFKMDAKIEFVFQSLLFGVVFVGCFYVCTPVSRLELYFIII